MIRLAAVARPAAARKSMRERWREPLLQGSADRWRRQRQRAEPPWRAAGREADLYWLRRRDGQRRIRPWYSLRGAAGQEQGNRTHAGRVHLDIRPRSLHLERQESTSKPLLASNASWSASAGCPAAGTPLLVPTVRLPFVDPTLGSEPGRTARASCSRHTLRSCRA